jgi:integrase
VKPPGCKWVARLVIPIDCRVFFGSKTAFSETTGSHDLTVAKRQRDKLLPGWREQIDRARAELDPAKWQEFYDEAHGLLAKAAEWQRREIDGVTREERYLLTSTALNNHLRTSTDARPMIDVTPPSPEVSFDDIVAAWKRGADRPAKTVELYTASLDRLGVHLGHRNGAKVSGPDMQAYQEHLEDSGLAQRSVKIYMSHLNTLFRAAVRRDKLKVNPCAGITVVVQKSKKRQEGFTMRELAMMLAASHTASPLIRWVIVNEMFSGTRPGEFIDANVQDFKTIGDNLVFHIRELHREEGQTIKLIEAVRRFPLHRRVVDQGFRDYLASLPAGSPLFPKVKISKSGKRVENASATVNDWIQRVTGTKKTLYFFRHTFKSVARGRIDRELRNYIMGHSFDDVAAEYGDYPLAMLAEAMAKIPADPMQWGFDE